MKKASTKRAPVKGQNARNGDVIKKAPRTIGKKAASSTGLTSGPEVRTAKFAGAAPIQG